LDNFLDYSFSAYAPGPDIISSHPGPEPFSPYASSYGVDTYSTLPGSGPGPGTSYLPPGGPDVQIPPLLKRKNFKVKGRSDSSNNQLIKSIEELVFGFLGVESQACRKRFVCEMEFKTKRNPFTIFAFTYLR
jgi:hypothetical protein